MFYDQYRALCLMRGVTPSGGADEMDLNRATVTFWKKEGFHPRQSTLEKLAAYFCVPASFLLEEPTYPCPLCGGDAVGHEARHRRWQASAEAFGFCWNRALRSKALTEATALSPALGGKEQTALTLSLLKAHFSESLEQSGFSLSHLPFAEFRRRMLARPAFEELLSPTVLRYLRSLPGAEAPAEASAFFPATLFETARPEMPVEQGRASSRLMLHDAATRLETVRFTGSIPVLGRIAAGAPLIAQEYVEEYIPTHLPHPEEYFALRIQGDSMIGAGIHSGDTVLIHQQSEAQDGQIVACLVNGEEATLKRFSHSGDTVLLLPENPRYPPFALKPADFESGKARILGVAIEVTHSLN